MAITSGCRPTGTDRRSLPTNLPYDVLAAIFLYCINVPVKSRPHGGYLASWQSNETMVGLTLVCKGWNAAATDVLYRSVCLDSRRTTEAFRRTLAELPHLADKVNYLTLRLSREILSATHEVHRLDDAFALLEALRSCAKTLTYLHIYPLPDLTRPPLFQTLSELNKLQVLVCSSRFLITVSTLGPAPLPIAPALPVGGHNLGLHSSPASHPRLILPDTLHTLELDFSSSWSAEAFPFHDGVTADGLRKIRLSCDADEDKLWQLLEQCTMLEVCELYFERLVAVDNPTVGDLERFDPTVKPLLDRLLSSYSCLETVSISATELSPHVIRLLPPSLVALEISAFNHVSTFFFTPQLVHDVRDERYATGLKSLRVHDAAEAWTDEEIESLKAACYGRGIEFHFDIDDDFASE
ncbi:hypothetical protein JCM11251_005985 [Rhodosporidiobolus azoricus]